jgi:nicotinate-nucleotide pyrophosphorylase (carboxylating)
MIDKEYLRSFIKKALQEDIGHSDITTEAIVPSEHKSRAKIVVKEACVLAGLDVAIEVFKTLDFDVIAIIHHKDGEYIEAGRTICELEGTTRVLLSGERLALNLLQRLSGIATLTAEFVKRLSDTSAKVVDTRKTTPGLRALEKYAVRVGGGVNHRFGLFDGILIKDNHIVAAGSIREAVQRARMTTHHLMKVEVEVTNMAELKEAIEAGADVVMLDNMRIEEMKEAVEYVRSIKPNVIVEASGGVSLENIKEVASTGVDIISVGALTHSATAVDIGMYLSPLTL